MEMTTQQMEDSHIYNALRDRELHGHHESRPLVTCDIGGFVDVPAHIGRASVRVDHDGVVTPVGVTGDAYQHT